MVNISVNGNKNNSIKVSANTNNSINTSAPSNKSVDTSTNADYLLARSWAVGEGLIQGEDYSAKHYANKAIVDVDSKFDGIQTSGNVKTSYNNVVLTIENYSFVFEQAVSSDEWVINHNLNKFPSVTIVDSSGNVFEPARRYVDENTVVVEMLGATTGKAYLN